MIAKPYTDKTAFANHAIEVTPTVLRLWASQFEQCLKNALPGQMVDLQVCNGVKLVAYKDLNTEGFVKSFLTSQVSPQDCDHSGPCPPDAAPTVHVT